MSELEVDITRRMRSAAYDIISRIGCRIDLRMIAPSDGSRKRAQEAQLNVRTCQVGGRRAFPKTPADAVVDRGGQRAPPARIRTNAGLWSCKQAHLVQSEQLSLEPRPPAEAFGQQEAVTRAVG